MVKQLRMVSVESAMQSSVIDEPGEVAEEKLGEPWKSC